MTAILLYRKPPHEWRCSDPYNRAADFAELSPAEITTSYSDAMPSVASWGGGGADRVQSFIFIIELIGCVSIEYVNRIEDLELDEFTTLMLTHTFAERDIILAKGADDRL